MAFTCAAMHLCMQQGEPVPTSLNNPNKPQHTCSLCRGVDSPGKGAMHGAAFCGQNFLDVVHNLVGAYKTPGGSECICNKCYLDKIMPNLKKRAEEDIYGKKFEADRMRMDSEKTRLADSSPLATSNTVDTPVKVPTLPLLAENNEVVNLSSAIICCSRTCIFSTEQFV